MTDVPTTAAPTLLPSHAALLDALTAAEGPVSVSQAARWISGHLGLRLDRAALARAMNELAHRGRVVAVDTGDGPRRWALATPGPRL